MEIKALIKFLKLVMVITLIYTLITTNFAIRAFLIVVEVIFIIIFYKVKNI
ncbi:hypothetical protein SNUCP2_09090 [Clostridium perfringens A]|uniref:Uncharacterized protein n=3 Tax=Clostridium perfringens TaxID=1502 RepID=Q8XMI9_CLOPE|nr:hypothetical protein FORC3_0695 [Clostridium perfringens]EDT24134.1 conserved hypothetical protein [Clostridium perfringens B str. ATCC 3626]EIA17952.1 hypothetical protein HA1_03579 [Clostridium perfringens F262]BAB80405.1 hypothetical protein [Clostridium perfringens str. 13]AOY53110.1 Hypothetical protein FORC25_0690 [Clostridium perfringens]